MIHRASPFGPVLALMAKRDQLSSCRLITAQAQIVLRRGLAMKTPKKLGVLASAAQQMESQPLPCAAGKMFSEYSIGRMKLAPNRTTRTPWLEAAMLVPCVNLLKAHSLVLVL